MTIPRPLQPGDTIALVAPSGPCEPARLAASIRVLESLGLLCHITESCHARTGYLAGADTLRARDINESFTNPNIRAVLAVRGGYGAQRLLPLLDYKMISANPKIFAGYSDITTLHIAFNQLCNLATYHAPMAAADFGGETVCQETLESFQSALFGKTNHRKTDHGIITPPIVGGNLTLITASLGTPYEIDTRNRTLFMEEIDEAPYRIDRMLMQLKLAGKLDDAAGFILGSFSPYTADDLTQCITDILKPAGKPIAGFPAGHCTPNHTFMLGG
jgi:muramoyltetrapeptide carboxypeptidase